MNDRIYIPRDFWSDLGGLEPRLKNMCAYMWTIADPVGVVRVDVDRFEADSGVSYGMKDLAKVDWWIKWLSDDEFLIRSYLKTQHPNLTVGCNLHKEAWSVAEVRWPKGLEAEWTALGLVKHLPNITGAVSKSTGERLASSDERRAKAHAENLKGFTLHHETDDKELRDAFQDFLDFRIEWMITQLTPSALKKWEFGVSQARREWNRVKGLLESDGRKETLRRLGLCIQRKWEGPLSAQELADMKSEKYYKGTVNNTPREP